MIDADQISVPTHESDSGELFDKETPALKLMEYDNHQGQEIVGIASEQVKIKVGSLNQEKVPLEVLLT